MVWSSRHPLWITPAQRSPIIPFFKIVSTRRTQCQNTGVQLSLSDTKWFLNKPDCSCSRKIGRLQSTSARSRRMNNFKNLKIPSRPGGKINADNGYNQRKKLRILFSHKLNHRKTQRSFNTEHGNEKKSKHFSSRNSSSLISKTSSNGGRSGHFRQKCRDRKLNLKSPRQQRLDLKKFQAKGIFDINRGLQNSFRTSYNMLNSFICCL